VKFKQSFSAALWAAMTLAAISSSQGLWSVPADIHTDTAIELPAKQNAVLSISAR
jgi:hypothetical protein